MTLDPANFLGTCEVIDTESPAILQTARQLAGTDVLETARRCFEFVRDEIRHSSDYQLNPVTCRASEVLEHRTGYCYAKSHLLCALLRASGIPAGLGYQRLSIDDQGPPFCLHGLCVVYLPQFGWYRIDPRGNRADVDAQFDPPHERLAFEPKLSGEGNLPGIYVSPLPEVLTVLTRCRTWEEVLNTLPDCDLDR